MRIDVLAHNSRLKDINPIEKFLFTFITILFLLMSKNNVVILFIFFKLNIVTVYCAGIRVRDTVKLYLMPIVVILFSIIPILISIKNGKIYILESDIHYSVFLFSRAVAMLSAVYLFILNTTIPDTEYLFSKLKVSGTVIEIIMLTYRYIFFIMELSQKIYSAQTARNGYCSYKQKLNSLAMLMSSLLIKSFVHAKRSATSMEARGYSGQIDFRGIRKKSSLYSYIYIAVWIIILFIIEFWR